MFWKQTIDFVHRMLLWNLELTPVNKKSESIPEQIMKHKNKEDCIEVKKQTNADDELSC